ncbi:ComF family protein [Colwellia sp. E2M01]|uniref:ComF family protein n=1 Tax=Colwellia sp. E2M01 TaxID=2841561 RepID=UPI001C08A07E|nr:ComF family protein [Colwellia sp. E2M01]MBU2869534.1 ComF family protein [Colwellia sp. E2M01]
MAGTSRLIKLNNKTLVRCCVALKAVYRSKLALIFNTGKFRLNNIQQHLSCCDLCAANVGASYFQEKRLRQALLCQHCINDLPFFKQDIINGNLLNWPTIKQALPNIHFEYLFALSPYIYPFNIWLAQMKYLGRFELANLFASLLYAQWQKTMESTLIPPADLVISVPLHVKKWQVRGYNQAHLIAQDFAQQLALPYEKDVIIRCKHNQSQIGKTGSQRRKNLANAFKLKQGLASHIKHVIIIDDVVTTGTTASEISKLLKSAGVEIVSVVALCLTLPKSKSSTKA